MDNKETIIKAGLYLLQHKLIARTWGNVSARESKDQFLITPSGKEYTKIRYQDIPLVNISDCSYNKKGPKPSGEKKVHACIYALRDDARYIVHTHQFYASAICAEEKDITLSDGTLVPCAPYGLPGTKKLSNAVKKTVQDNPDCNIFLMAKHGAIIIGKTMKETLLRAEYLEDECKKIFKKRCPDFYVPEKMNAYLDDYAQIMPPQEGEDKQAIKMVKEKNAAAYLYIRETEPISDFDQKLQHLVYKYKYSKLRNKK